MPQSLIPGRPVPALSLPLVGGETFDLSAEKPDYLTLVEVYRGLHCPRCKRHLIELSGLMPRFAARGVGVVAISTDPQDRAELAHRQWALGDLRLGYGLGAAVARQWGVYLSAPISASEPGPFAEPATFFIRPNGTLYAANYATTPFARARWSDWLEGLDAARARDYPPRGDLG